LDTITIMGKDNEHQGEAQLIQRQNLH
jgi:hypothetical protein